MGNCKPGAIRGYIRSKLHNVTRAVNIIHNLVSGLENETLQLQADQVSRDSTETNETTTDELNNFDQLDAQIENTTDENQSIDFNELGKLDKECATNRISSTMPRVEDKIHVMSVRKDF